MKRLLALSRIIDRVNETIGKWIAWLVVVAALVSAGNAVVRKLLDTS
jgi:TRAP-type mannitol/chloroaromatic compound transport system permease small subunit